MPIARFGPDDRALSFRETSLKTSLSRAELDRRVKDDPSFPRPLNVGPRRKAFMLSDVMGFLERRASAAVVEDEV